jgi:hypothetical protein
LSGESLIRAITIKVHLPWLLVLYFVHKEPR